VGDELFDSVAPVIGALGLELVDLELRSGVVRVTIDREGGVDLDSIADATRELSGYFDRHDPVPAGRYTLEVSSPGLERSLRTPQHFKRAVGEEVSVRTLPTSALERRLKGIIESADEDGVVLNGEGLPEGGSRIAYAEIERARTVFEWGPAPKPNAAPKQKNAKPGRKENNSTPSTPKKAVAS